MADSSGVNSKAIAHKEPKQGSYGHTATAANFAAATAYAVPLVSEGLSTDITRDHDPVLDGRAAQIVGDETFLDVTGDMELRAWYEGIEFWLAMMFGFEHPDTSPKSLGGGLYRHLYEIDNCMARQGWLPSEQRLPGNGWLAGDKKVRAFKLGVDKNVTDHVVEGGMLTSLGVRIAPDAITATLGVNARTEQRGDYTAGSWTAFTNNRRPLFSGLVVSIGSIDGTTFPYAAQPVNLVEFNIAQTLKTDDQSADSGVYKIEPERDGEVEVTGRFSFPRYTANGVDLIDQFDSFTEMKARIVLTRPTTLEVLQVMIPRFKFETADAPTSGPSLRTLELPFRAYKPHDITDSDNPFHASAPDTWASIISSMKYIKNNPLCALVDNQNTGNIFTEV